MKRFLCVRREKSDKGTCGSMFDVKDSREIDGVIKWVISHRPIGALYPKSGWAYLNKTDDRRIMGNGGARDGREGSDR